MALSKLAVRRLTKLAEFMEGLPKKASGHFAMSTWVQHRGEENGVRGTHGIEADTQIGSAHIMECGMKACALGWGCSVPSFRRAGLRWMLQTSWSKNGAFVPTYDGVTSMDAARLFFDLKDDQTYYLFRDVDATTPKQWARLCRKFIRDNSRA